MFGSLLRRAVSLFLSACVLAASAGCAQPVMIGRPPPPRVGTDLTPDVQWEYSTDRGQTWSSEPPVVRGGKTALIYVRGQFTVDDPSRYTALALTPGLPGRTKALFRLNDEPVPVPERGMRYRTIPAIPPGLLRSGANVLEGKIGFDNRPPTETPSLIVPDARLALGPRLAGLEAPDLRITWGPVLGAMDADNFTVTCRTNFPARASAYVYEPGDGRITLLGQSEPGRYHRLRLPRGQSVSGGLGVLVAQTDKHAAAEVFRIPPWPKSDETLRMVIMGDSRTNPDKWAAVAEAALASRPHLLVFSGDMVSAGRDDWLWPEEFHAAARELLTTIPFYPVIGNHEEDAPIYPLLFYAPDPEGLALNWAQEIHGVLLIGVDGHQDWSEGSDNLAWLDEVLTGSQARFIFLVNHYPGWSSGKHAVLSLLTGKPAEREVREARQHIIPLLARHGATAFFCGHDHCYERSELPGGFCHVVSGGAGAPLYAKSSNARAQNPYSAHFAKRLHYCLLEVKGDTCTMQAIGTDGTVFDSRTFSARKPGAIAAPATEPAAARP